MAVVKLFANLRSIAETKEVSVTGASLGACVMSLVEQIPALDGVILQNGQIRPHFVININGHAALDSEIPVNEEDTIAIFPPIAGG